MDRAVRSVQFLHLHLRMLGTNDSKARPYVRSLAAVFIECGHISGSGLEKPYPGIDSGVAVAVFIRSSACITSGSTNLEWLP
jgi:hypothetical protein